MHWVWQLLLSLPLLLPPVLRAEADYARDIQPLLRSRCVSCHGALKQKADLRLDTAALILKGGKSGAVIQPGNAAGSKLIARVTAADVAERMPPEHEGEPLSTAQVELLRTWIQTGAPAPVVEEAEADPRNHWAFRPLHRPAPPKVRATAANRNRNPIDAFIAEQRELARLSPQPEAPRAVLLRRLYLDLLGLPPTPDAIAAFEADSTPDWYEKVVDRLLEDPRHGERWARHWMDIWRYSDWWGLGDQLRNSQKHIWHWRDWIVESVNADLPYDEMLREMLAADELHPNDPGKLRATGFLARNYFLFNRNQWMDETVEHVGKGFLGLTLNCAKCHDHKYDPISQVDYYRMRAFFEPYHARLDVVPGEPDLTRDGIPRVFDGRPETPTYRFIRGQENNPDKATPIAPGIPAMFNFRTLEVRSVALPPEAWVPARRPWVLPAYESAARLKIEPAATAFARARERLAAAQARGAATNILALAEAEIRLAELALALAVAESASVQRRAEAEKASWTTMESREPSAASTSDAATHGAPGFRQSAIRAERDVAAARARLGVAEAELKFLRTAADKKGAAEVELKAARATLEKAEQKRDAAIPAEERYAELPGALWTPTRFFDSTKDDPKVNFPRESTGRRTALAQWITDPRNPLTARVAVNHLWNRHFGSPLAAPLFDLGRKNATPIHHDLIDWLAGELIDHDWSLKHLHRLIVNSATYRLSSSLANAETNQARDPDNLRWWRRTPIRLEAQVIRDSILSLADDLESTRGGPPVAPADQENSRRRSLYFFHSNNDRNLFLTTFDEANVKECYRRDQTIVPQQALALSNSKLVLDAAARISAQLGRAETPGDSDTFIRRAFARVLGFDPGAAEIAASRQALASWRQLPEARSAQDPEAIARTQLIWALLNHNDFVTLR